MTTLQTLTAGQTFTITEAGHQFEGRTMTVKTVGATGRTLLALDATTGNKVFLKRNESAVEVA
jgi:hypothetical protein